MKPKSLYESCAGRHFYGTENEIWAGFGPVGSTEKEWRTLMSNFEGGFFHVFRGKKIISFGYVDSYAKILLILYPPA